VKRRRWSLVLLGGALLLLAGHLFRDRPEPSPPTASAPRIEAEVRRAEELERRRHSLLWRLGEQRRIIGELAAGRCTLREAAGRFREMARQEPLLLQTVTATYQGDSEEEVICRWVIGYVRVQLEDHPQEAAEVAARLEAELRTLLAEKTLDFPQEPPRSN
jgi:hypothetical protein